MGHVNSIYSGLDKQSTYYGFTLIFVTYFSVHKTAIAASLGLPVLFLPFSTPE